MCEDQNQLVEVFTVSLNDMQEILVPDMTKMLDEITFKNYDHNMNVVIPYIQTKVSSFLAAYPLQTSDNFFIKNLLKRTVDQDWIAAQCKSILDYIEYIQSDLFKQINDEENQIFIMQHFFYDYSQLSVIAFRSNFPIDLDPYKSPIGLIGKSRTMSSQQFFLESKFSYSTHKNGFFNSITPFSIYSTPVLIRQSIEIKVKELLKIQTIKNVSNSSDAIVGINKYLEFIKRSGCNIFNLPVNIDDLIDINKWTNTFVHEGYNEFIWKIQSSISTLEPLFAIVDETRGIGYHADGITFYLDQYTGQANASALNTALLAAFSTDSVFMNKTITLY